MLPGNQVRQGNMVYHLVNGVVNPAIDLYGDAEGLTGTGGASWLRQAMGARLPSMVRRIMPTV